MTAVFIRDLVLTLVAVVVLVTVLLALAEIGNTQRHNRRR